MKKPTLWLLSLLAVGNSQAQELAWNPLGEGPRRGPEANRPNPAYWDAIQRTAAMAHDQDAQRLAQRYGLNVLNLTWEDTGRYKNSAVGPNISDMTIQVGARDPRSNHFDVKAMPVVRYPNFSDTTADLDPRDITLMVGNQNGRRLQRVSLYDFLKEPTRYLSDPNSWLGRDRSLVAPRDSKVLVSAQACFLPVPRSGLATFNPVLFNYQSRSGDPAVLTILATREGTSVTVIDNKRDAFSTGGLWGQRLFHNDQGQRASLTGQRESDYKASGGGGSTKGDPESGLNMVLLIQVPLKQKTRMRDEAVYAPSAEALGGAAYKAKSGVENAVISHGEAEGPFTEIDNLAIERDDRFPVRVTVQFYKATDDGVVSNDDMREIKQSIDRVYERSDSVGSLVTGGNTGRVTEYDGCKVQPFGWWEDFWRRHEANAGESRFTAIAKLRKLLGNNYRQKPVCDLYLRDLLR